MTRTAHRRWTTVRVLLVEDDVRLADIRRFAEALAPGLRPDVTLDEATDVLWLLLDPVAIQRLVVGRG
jgi:hypothetical protein